ncbi:MAG: HD domain-containing protein, partial [Candidatus Izimaplasma sp.]|nr:HD domain-containing protein [Candidatus Izimaplasma bacterium]
RAHANWTDANNALANKDSDWLEENISFYLTDGHYDIDFVFITNETEDFSLANNIDETNIINSNLYNEILNNNIENNSILWINDFAYLLVGMPFSNDDSTQSSGVFITGKILNQTDIEHLKTILDDIHSEHFELTANPLTTLEPPGNKVSTIRVNSIDDSIYIHAHFKYAFSDYIQSTVIIHSMTITLSVLLLLSGFILAFFFIFNRELKRTVNQIQNMDITTLEYQKVNTTKSSELNQIIDPFNALSKRVFTQYKKSLDKNVEIVQLLSKASEMNDIYTKEHGDSVASMAEKIGKKLNITNIDQLILSAKLHDIGKVFIPLDILNKKSKLTTPEYEVVKNHPANGYNLLEGITGFDKIREGILHHHERYDGLGYPNKLKANEIPLFSRIIAVADVYDALTSDRSYRNKFTKEAAIKTMRNGENTFFDPKILKIFLQIVED